MVVAEREKVQMKEVAPATILLCAWRNLVCETAECLLMLRDQGWGYIIKRGDALIERARSQVVSDWYRNTSEDVFLMIDDDVVFEGSGAAKVVQLARDTRSVACAAYPVKDGGHLACRRFLGQDILFGENAPVVEIVYPATGFMAVHRDVIDAMVAAKDPFGEPVFPMCDAIGQNPMWPFFDCFAMKHDDGRYEYLSEDYAFGEQARRLGFKVWLDPSVILYHMGFYPYTIENMKNVKNIEVQAEPVETADGFRMWLPQGDRIIRTDIVNQGAWDIDTRDAILRHLQPGWTFLDLGAHVGCFSLLAASKGAKVIAIEPVPESAQMLRENAHMNGYLIDVHEVAVTDSGAKQIQMVTSTANTGGAFRAPTGNLIVPATSLGDILDGRWPEFIKADIEGDEYRVLAANPEVLQHAKVIVVEASEYQLQRNSGAGVADLLDLLTDAGFSMSQVSDRGAYSDWLGVKE